MPIVRIAVRKGRSPAEKKAVLQAVHSALVEALKIPEDDRKGVEAAVDDMLIDLAVAVEIVSLKETRRIVPAGTSVLTADSGPLRSSE